MMRNIRNHWTICRNNIYIGCYPCTNTHAHNTHTRYKHTINICTIATHLHTQYRDYTDRQTDRHTGTHTHTHARTHTLYNELNQVTDYKPHPWYDQSFHNTVEQLIALSYYIYNCCHQLIPTTNGYSQIRGDQVIMADC